MARASNQRLKILYIYEALQKSDEHTPLTVSKLIKLLAANGIEAERKSVYADLDALEAFGLDIIRTGSGNRYFYLGTRTFELPEIKLLVDAVQASKFITKNKSVRLIEKLASLAGGAQESILRRQMIIQGVNKTQNEAVLINIDQIHAAIEQNRMLYFKYFHYVPENGKLVKKLRKKKLYTVSPWALVWDDEYYYLVAHDGESNLIKHYRVDKMGALEIAGNPREGLEAFRGKSVAEYTGAMFSMFSGREEMVRFSCADRLVGVIADRFGEQTTVLREAPGWVTFTVKVRLSPLFYSWVVSFGSDMKIISPQYARDRMRFIATELNTTYRG